MIDAIAQALLSAVAVFCGVGACAGTIVFIVLCGYLSHSTQKTNSPKK